jgi:hypothetical protein
MLKAAGLVLIAIGSSEATKQVGLRTSFGRSPNNLLNTGAGSFGDMDENALEAI